MKLLRARKLTMADIGDMVGPIALIAKAHGASPASAGSTRSRFVRPSA